jgi:antitoxin component YwqK of YwqJK toxin-antitoxin module
MLYRKYMRSLLLISLILGPFFSVTGQSYEPKKKVKSMLILDEKHDMLFSKTVKDYEAWYDNHGNIIEEINYKQGKVSKHFKYYYDSDDNKIKEEEFNASGKMIEWSEYKIEDGLRVEKIVYDNNNKIKSRKIYQYTK